ncbi:dicarboxylate/amino acid:cation symporter [Texcoconibacillus texcoconensis]|uniref:Na+/H+-dicarboxylate symporter n=1 Tax=Texcoconibacillus texcoconensis TaxID=1095777 RepID=A0A840QRB3_9BACI|nr:dicarboxylate/amino acid:cation symporter [Texcoconibacillus texcoconensis]MBB5173863.1 Na+/H+-dicarboxylate symporter [Texcoconibacillus texcoconensis]
MKGILRTYWETSLILKITIALILGVIVGLLIGETGVAILAPFGDLLMNLLMFLIIPLVLFTLIVGVNQSDIKDLGRMGGKVFIYYAVTSAVAIIVGLAVSRVFSPGTGMTLTNETFEAPENPGVVNVILSIVPDNIVAAFSELNLLGIIFTALAFGIAISSLRSSATYHETGALVYKVIDGLNEATFRIMNVILQYVPIGIFAIIATTVADQGINTLVSLGEMVGVLYIALIVQVLFYILFMKLSGVSVKSFFRAARTPMITAFATQSSSGTLPLTLNAAQRLGLNKGLYSFSLPLGATVNMDGAAIRIAVSATFAANVIGDPLTFPEMFQVVLLGTLVSIGTAGVPGAGMVMIATVFAQLGLPLEAVALLAAVDALVGMGCTSLNVTGDLTGSSIINKTEKHQKETAEAQ